MTYPTDDNLILFTVPEAAWRLKVSAKSIRRWITAGGLSAIRLGRSVRISRGELERFVAERTAKRDPSADQ